MSRLRKSFAAALLPLLATLSARPALADPHAEEAAQSALDKAQGDYASERYKAGSGRLRKALAGCAGKKCSAKTKAALLRDIGTMQFRAGDKGGAAKTWARALALDPTLSLNPAYDSGGAGATALRSGWEAARSAGGVSASAPAPPASSETPPEASPSPPAAATPEPTAPSAATASGAAAEAPKNEKENGEPAEGTTSPKGPAAEEGEKGEPEAKEKEPARAYPHVWIGVAGAIDFIPLPSDSDVCLLNAAGSPVNSNHYRCYDPVSGVDVPGGQRANAVLIPGEAGSAPGGLQFGDVRAMVSIDYAVLEHAMIGIRAGYVFNSYPGTAGKAFSVPLHLEGRLTFLASPSPLMAGALAPIVFAGGGIAEFDGRQTTTVARSDTMKNVTLDAWISEGPAFVLAGAGVRYQLSMHAALTVAARVNMVVDPGAIPTFGPEVGLQFGL